MAQRAGAGLHGPGDLGVLTNARADELVTLRREPVVERPDLQLQGAVAGDFSELGLGDIDDTNVESVLGAWNGGGIDVIYDSDGSIMTNFFGLPPTGVLGITNIDYVEADGPEILEAWMVLSGPGIHANDPNGVGFQGVVTHEMGHALNLAHSQANGAVWNPIAVRLASAGRMLRALDRSGRTASQVETMYPISTPEPGDSGEYMGTVDRLDDMSALSDIYPAPGYPGNRGTISGQILDSSGAPVTGVNVIARNVADPFNDFRSYISGQVSKGQAGPDGSFALNDLTPGARYVIYVDNLLIGAFSVPRLSVLPGPEEYFNGAMESGDSALDDRCAWVTVAAQPGAPATADITFGRYARRTHVHDRAGQQLSLGHHARRIDRRGRAEQLDGPVFRWDLNAGTFENIGGFRVGRASISDDGTKIASTSPWTRTES